MPRCANGHPQGLVLRCKTCGSEVSYREACSELLNLPAVKPDLGEVQMISAGFPAVLTEGGLSSVVGLGDAPDQSVSSFTLPRIQGGTWLDYYSKHTEELGRWLRLTGFDKSASRFAAVDTTSPLGVMTVAALPAVEKTVVIAVVADSTSTPLEQNASYAAVSTTLKMGFPVIALSQDFVREAFVFEEGKTFISQAEAAARLVHILLGASGAVVDLVERDLRLGVQLHCLSAIVSGSKRVYGSAANAFLANAYGLSIEAAQGEVKTVYPIVFADDGARPEFLRSFSQVRTKRYANALSADCLFQEKPGSGAFDIVTLFGLGDDALLRGLAGGYDAVAKRVPGLEVESIG